MTVWPVRFIDPRPPNKIKFPRIAKIRVPATPTSGPMSHLKGGHTFHGNAGPLRRKVKIAGTINSLLLRFRTSPTVSWMPVDYDPQVFSEGVGVMSIKRITIQTD
jgi:hypothetical protein